MPAYQTQRASLSAGGPPIGNTIPRSRFRSRAAVVLAAGLLVPLAVSGQVVLTPEGPVNPQQKARGERGPETFKLQVDASPEPSPALRYRLVMPYLDQTPGNAAPYYYRALVLLLDGRREAMQRFYDNEERWLNAPVSEMPRDEVHEFLGGYTAIFEQLATATRRETLDWDWRMQDLRGMQPIQFVLTETQEMRSLARLLRLKARLEIAEGRHEDALETLRTGYALGRAAAAPPTMINKLVGIAICSIMHIELRELIAAPGAPNLYWALSELERPLIDMRSALQYEMSMPQQMFPFLRDAETSDRSAEEWQRVIREAFERFAEVQGLVDQHSPTSQRVGVEFMAAGLVLRGFPRAKEDLIAAGFDAERVEKMPVAQVVAIHQARVYRHVYHETFKWSLLPYAEAAPRRRTAEDTLKAEGYLAPAGAGREIIPIAALLLPAVFQALEAEIRLESRTAGLRALEAVRMQAAADGGKWPNSLKDVTVVPVPANPRDGKPFPYRVEGETAFLEVPIPATPQVGWRFETTLRKPQTSTGAGENSR